MKAEITAQLLVDAESERRRAFGLLKVAPLGVTASCVFGRGPLVFLTQWICSSVFGFNS